MTLTLNGTLKRDDNDYPVMGGTSSVDNATIINSAYDPSTRRLLVDLAGNGVTILTATGTVNGNNTSFTFTSLPTIIVSDGASYQQTNSLGQTVWSWNAGTKTATLTLPPQSDIFGEV